MEILEPMAAELAQVNDKGFVPDEVRNDLFRRLRQKNDNRTCFDCTSRNPTWISLTFGVYVCLECSGNHRRMGTHITFVRSVDMDKFSPDQLVHMGIGGNGKALQFFKNHGMGKLSDAGRRVDYSSKIAARYVSDLDKLTKDTCTKLNIGICPVVADVAAEGNGTEAGEAKPKAGEKGYKPLEPMSLADALKHAAPKSTIIRKAEAKPSVPKSVVVRKVVNTNPVKAAAPPPASGSGYVAAQLPVAAVAPPTPDVSPKSTSPVNAKPVTPTLAPAGAPVVKAVSKAKEMEFDFDFDELETQANKPAPAMPEAKPKSKPSSPTFAPQRSDGSYGKERSYSTDEVPETAQERMDRMNKYDAMKNSGAISSDAFFGNESPTSRVDGAVESMQTSLSRGADAASKVAQKGSALLDGYLAKMRN